MTTPLGGTQTMFVAPQTTFPDTGRLTIFNQIIQLVETNCVENEEWKGETRHFPIVTGTLTQHDVESVFKLAKTWCSAFSVAFYTTSMGAGNYLIGISSTEPVLA